MNNLEDVDRLIGNTVLCNDETTAALRQHIRSTELLGSAVFTKTRRIKIGGRRYRVTSHVKIVREVDLDV